MPSTCLVFLGVVALHVLRAQAGSYSCNAGRLQALENTTKSFAVVHLGAQTATQPAGTLPTQDPVNMSFEYPITGVNPELPWIMLMPGFNCYAQEYTRIQTLLAGRGYLVAITDEFHPTSSIPNRPTLAITREPQCSNISFNAPTASILEDTHTLVAHWTRQNTSASSFAMPVLPAAAQAAIESTNSDSAVVVGHSAGGRVALDIVTGLCENPAEFLCPSYTEADRLRDLGYLKGIIAWESLGSIVPTNDSLDIPDGVFMTYLSSVNNSVADRTVEAFEQTVGACVSLIQFSSGNHYAMTDWNPHSAPYQKAACGDAAAPSEATTEAEQEERLVLIAELADADIRAQLLSDSASASYFVNEVSSNALIHMADLALDCYDV